MINLKSDIVNTPTAEMWEAMRSTKTGWVIDREDPSVNKLETLAADIMGKEAALFILTGRMANLVALMTFGSRGHQIILEKNSHIAWSEEWGLSYICGLYPRLIEGVAGVINPKDLEAAITESRFSHIPTTDVVCLENTHNIAGGTILNLKYTEELCKVAHKHGAKVFIDGARIFHAAIALGVKPKELVATADAVMFSLVKGLSAPGGALLCGKACDIERACINLRRLGAASFHRAGILAAAGIVALENMIDRLAEDQRKAKSFAKTINQIQKLGVDMNAVQTNIVMVNISKLDLNSDKFLEHLNQYGVKAHKCTQNIVRFTFHRNITDKDVETVVENIKKIVNTI